MKTNTLKKNQVKKMSCFLITFTSFSHMAFHMEKPAINKNEATYYTLYLTS